MIPLAYQSKEESNGTWVSLLEYSVRSGVSLSTIRRKIKNNQIEYRLDRGKYFVLWPRTNNMAPHAVRSDLADWSIDSLTSIRAHNKPTVYTKREMRSEKSLDDTSSSIDTSREAIELLSSAFEISLLKKDNLIQQLREENKNLILKNEELEHLVRLLEDRFGVRYTSS